jgi:hypothetical protein
VNLVDRWMLLSTANPLQSTRDVWHSVREVGVGAGVSSKTVGANVTGHHDKSVRAWSDATSVPLMIAHQ